MSYVLAWRVAEEGINKFVDKLHMSKRHHVWKLFIFRSCVPKSNNTLPNLKAGKRSDPNWQDFCVQSASEKHGVVLGLEVSGNWGSLITIWWAPCCYYSPSNFESKLWPNSRAVWKFAKIHICMMHHHHVHNVNRGSTWVYIVGVEQ